MENLLENSDINMTPELNDFYSKSFAVNGNPANEDVAPKPGNDLDSLINKLNNNSAMIRSNTINLPSQQDPFNDAKLFTYNPTYKGLNYDRYSKMPEFDELGFSPFRDNEKLYNEQSSIFSDALRGASGFKDIFISSFINTAADLPKLLTGDWSPNEEAARDTERIMAETMSSRGTLGSSIVNFGINSAFTFGIIAEMLAEDFLVGAASSLLAAPTGGASIAAGATAMGGRAVEAVSTIGNLYKGMGALGKAIKGLDDVNAARTYFTQFAKGTANFLNPLRNTTAFVSDIQDLKGLGQMAKLAKGFGAFYRDISDINRSFSEAKLEGGFVQNEMLSELTDAYYEKHGVMASGSELDKIKQVALEAGYKNQLINLPVIHYTNNISLGNLARPLKKILGNTESTYDLLGRTISSDIRRETVHQVLDNGFKASLKRGVNPKNILKNTFSYFSANLAEGLQESFQEASAVAIKDYYTKLYFNEEGLGRKRYELSYLDSYGKGFKDQLSRQGLETFMSGFLMGGVMHGAKTLSNKTAPYIQDLFSTSETRNKNKQSREARKAELDVLRNNIVNDLNEFHKSGVNLLSPDLENMNAQEILAKKMEFARKNGDKKFLIDFADEALFKQVSTALYTGKFDLFTEKLESLLNLNNDELADALNVEDGEAGRERLLVSLERAKDIKHRYKSIKPNPIKYKHLEEGDYKNEMLRAHKAYEDARGLAIFTPYSFDRVLDRMSSITEDFASIPLVAKGKGAGFLHLFGVDNIVNEIDNLLQESSILSEGLQPHRDEAKLKQSKIKDLTKLLDVIVDYKAYHKEFNKSSEHPDTEPNPAYGNRLRKAFEKYLETHADIDQGILRSDKLDDAFNLFEDYYKLDLDQENLSQAIAVVSNPNFLTEQANRNFKALTDLLSNLNRHNEESVKSFIDKVGLNALFNNLYNAGYAADPKQAVAYNLSHGKNKITTFYNIKDYTRITDTAELAKINKIIEDYEFLNNIKPEVVEEVKQEEVADENLDHSESTDLVLEVYPVEIQTKLKEAYSNYARKDEETIEEFLESPEAKRIIGNEKPIVQPIPENLEDTPGYEETMGQPPKPVSNLEAKKADIEARRKEDLLGKSFTTTTEKVVIGKGQFSGKTIVRYTESKVSSDGEVLTIKPKAKFKNEDTPLSTTPETITVKEFKQQFYENLSEQDKEMFDEIFTDDSTRIKLVEAKIGLKGSAKGQVNIDIQSLDGQPFGFELQNGKEINAKYDAELVALESPVKEKEEIIAAPIIVNQPLVSPFSELDEFYNDPNKFVLTDDKKGYYNINKPDEIARRASELKPKFEGDTKQLNIASQRGDIIDFLLRRFFEGRITLDNIAKAGDEYSKYYHKNNVIFTTEFYDKLYAAFVKINQNFTEKEWTIVSDLPTLYGYLGTELFAGTIDMLAKDKEGNFYIIDLKTSNADRRRDYLNEHEGDNNYGYMTSDKIQLNTYKELFYQRTGIKVKGMFILPIQTIVSKKTERKHTFNSVSLSKWNDTYTLKVEDESIYDLVPEQIKKQNKPVFPLADLFKGKIIYVSPGIGKSTLAKMFPDQFVDMDELLYEVFKDTKGFEEATPDNIGVKVSEMYERALDPNNEEYSDAREMGVDIFDVVNEFKKEKYKEAFDKAKALKESGKTILTGSRAYIGLADITVKASKDEVLKQGLKNKRQSITDSDLNKAVKDIRKAERSNNVIISIEQDQFTNFLKGEFDIQPLIDSVKSLKEMINLGALISVNTETSVFESYQNKLNLFTSRHNMFKNVVAGNQVEVLSEDGKKMGTLKVKETVNDNIKFELPNSLNLTELSEDNSFRLVSVITEDNVEGIKIDDLDNSQASDNVKTSDSLDLADLTRIMNNLDETDFDDLTKDAEDPDNCTK